jgi:hypothetical protein
VVPIPNASAPNAPWVEVWLSPQTTVMPGWARPPRDRGQALTARRRAGLCGHQRIYVEQVNYATSPPTYQFDGKWIPMRAIKEQIQVAGQATPTPFTVYRTIDGPVFSADTTGGTAFSLRFASWNRETGSLAGFSQLGGDTNLRQFRHSMSLITTLHNFFYADRRGNIAYFGDGLVPVEPSFTKVDPRLPALGNGTEQWLGYVPFRDMPHSVNPAQGFLDNWNTKPSAQAFYQQNEGDEYWGTIFRSQRISQLLQASTTVSISYLENIEHSIGTIDNGDNTRPAARYFIPFLVRAYEQLVRAHSPLVSTAAHPDLARAIRVLKNWDAVTTLGSPAMSIFMNFLEAYERNVFEGGTFPSEQYTGAVNFSDTAVSPVKYGGLGGMGTYNFLYHILARTQGVLPCGTLCYAGDYFAGHRGQLLVESLSDAITILSGTGPQLGQNVPGFGTADIAKWGFAPAQDQDWDSLDLRHEREPEPQHVHDGRGRRSPARHRPGRAAARAERLHLGGRGGEPAPLRSGWPVQRLQV